MIKYFKNEIIQIRDISLAWLLPMLALVAFGFGFFGFLAIDEGDGIYALHSAALKTFQLFILNIGPMELSNWQTRLASILAPLTTAVAAMVAFSARIKNWLRWTDLQINPPHDLYFGAGQTAATIARSILITSMDRVRRQVAIDLEQNTALAEVLKNVSDCMILQGDVTLTSTMRKANVNEAGRVWIVAGNDKKNISILENLITYNRQFSNVTEYNSSPLVRQWFVDIANPDMVRLASTLFRSPPGVSIEYFNIERLAARRIIKEFIENVLPTLCKELISPPILHLCIVGANELAEALILQSIQQLVLSENPENCLRITWLAPDANERMRKLRKRVPALGDIASDSRYFSNVLPLAIINCIDVDELNISPDDWLKSQKNFKFSAVYITGNDELSSVGSMLRISALRDLKSTSTKKTYPIILCHCNDLPNWSDENLIDGVFYFNVAKKIFRSDEDYPGEHMDGLAKVINASYHISADSQKPNDSIVEIEWSKLADPMKWSSRMSADHTAIKYTLLTNLNLNRNFINEGLFFPTAIDFEENIDFLASIEHRRFVVERFIDGWLPLDNSSTCSNDSAPSGLTYSKQKNLLRLNTTLIRYSRLSHEDRLKILPSIRILPNIIDWISHPNQQGK